jgi:hypothetical protein
MVEEVGDERGKEQAIEVMIQDFNVTLEQAMKAIFLSQDNNSSSEGQSIQTTHREKKVNQAKKVQSIVKTPF